MSKSCWVIPSILNSKGEKVDSKLFKDLLSFSDNNRKESIRIYKAVKNEQFLKDYKDKVKLDENGEVTIASLIKNINLKQVISDSKVLEKLNKEIGHTKKNGETSLHPMTQENYNNLLQKVINFNKTSEFKNDYIARVIKVSDKESKRIYFSPVVEKRNKLNQIEESKAKYNYHLNNRLKDLLTSSGVSIGALSELEERQGINGITDFDQAKQATEGTIELIRLAKGERGEMALGEEFAHFALEAIGDNPLKDRVLNTLNNDEIIKDVLGDNYDKYVELYSGNREKLIKEVAGKLLNEHLLKQHEIQSNKPYKNILTRLIQSIKDFFKKMDVSPYQRAIYEAGNDLGEIARSILNESLKLDVNNLKDSSDRLYNVTIDRAERDQKLLQTIIDNEEKRLHIYGKRDEKGSKYDIKKRDLISKLEEDLQAHETLEGINNFIANATIEAENLSKRLKDEAANNDLNAKALALRNIRNFIFSYKGMTSQIRDVVLEEIDLEDNRFEAKTKATLDNLDIILTDLTRNYDKVAMPLFVDFIKHFLGESIEIPFGKFKGKLIKAEELVKYADKDITFFDRWLDSMADSSDDMLKIMDQAVKKSKESARVKTMELMEELKAETVKLKQAGFNDQDFMFEVDSNGNKTGKYIQDLKWGEFYNNQKEFFNKINEKYPDESDLEQGIQKKREIALWYKDNMEYVDGEKLPQRSKYENKVYKSLSPAQKDYYHKIIEIKEKLDKLIELDDKNQFNTIKIRKDLLERLKGVDGFTSGGKQIWESIKDSFMRNSNDVELGSKNILKDFEGKQVQTLPIFYTNLKEGESENDVSTDIVSTFTAYASMAHEFESMNKIIDVLEVGRDLLNNREVTETEGGKPLMEKFKAVGRQIESKLSNSGDSTRFMQRLNDFFEMQVYGRYMKDEGTFGDTKVDIAKSANLLNGITAMSSLALNVLGGISNVVTGTVMNRIEAVGGEFYNYRNTVNADRIYGKETPALLSEINSNVKTSKLGLWNERLDILQDYDKEKRDIEFNKSKFAKWMSTNTLFFMSNAGEHWMQSRTSLALADNTKLKDNKGNLKSLWDAMEVKFIDPNNKALGAKLELRDEFKHNFMSENKEGKLEFDKQKLDDYLYKFSRKSSALNERMHGIYNSQDKNAFQRLAIGRMAMMFRKYMRPSYNRRFESVKYNQDLESWTEGYYSTSWRFFAQMFKDAKGLQLNLASNWDKLTLTEKSNIRKAITEMSHFLAALLVMSLFGGKGDRDRPWRDKMLEYQARRLYNELGAMTPNPMMVSEALKLMQSPAAGINTLEKALGLVKLMNPYNYVEEMKSGRLKGHSKAFKALIESPFGGIINTVDKGIHPERAIKFYTSGK